MTRLDLTQKNFLGKNDKVKSPDQLSDYAEEIKKAKELLKEKEEELSRCTNEDERLFILEEITEIKRDIKGYDLTYENLTVAEYNARKEVEKRKWLDEPVLENVFVKELREDYPERMDLFNRLLNIINTGWSLAISHTPKEKKMYFNIINETDLALALINYNPEEKRFYFNPARIKNTHPLRENQALVGFKFNSDYIEKFQDSITEEEKKPLYPVLKSDDEAKKIFGKDYEYEIYFYESEIGSQEYNELNKKVVSHVEKDGFLTIFMFINKINLDTILEKSSQYLGFDPIYDSFIDITEINGNILNTIDIPEYLLYSIGTIADDREIALTVNKDRTIEFKIRDKRPIFASGKEDLAVAIPRNLIEMREYGKELTFPYHYNLPGIGIVSPKVVDGKVRLEKTSKNKLTLEMAMVIDWRKSANEFGEREYPPQKQVEIMVDMDNVSELPICNRVIPIPYIDTKGKCHYTEGYDEENQILQFHVEQLKFKKISNFPTREEINKAKIILHEPFEEFPFESESDYTNLISLILTPFLSTVIHNALKPAFCVKAADVGNGKTLSAESAVRIFSKNYIISNITGDEAEVDRKLLSLLSCFPDAIILDNVNKINSPSLALNLTSRHYSGRQIGTSKTLVLPNNATIIMTGNNPELSKEIARRSVFISLNAKMENSEYGRKFKIKYLDRYIEENRADLIWACLTIIEAWFSAGKPIDKEFKPMGSFEEWSITMAGILANAGYRYFLDNRASARQIVDTESIGWKILISSIYAKFGSNKINTSDIYNIAKDIEGINIQGKNPIDCKKHLARQLHKNLNKVYSDYMLTDGGELNKSRAWKILKLNPSGTETDEQTAWEKSPLY